MKSQGVLCFFLVWGLCASWAAAQSCPASFLGPATDYNVFLLGGGSGNTFDLTNGDVEGRIASNGDFRGVNLGVGTRLGNCPASTDTVIIGGYIP